MARDWDRCAMCGEPPTLCDCFIEETEWSERELSEELTDSERNGGKI